MFIISITVLLFSQDFKALDSLHNDTYFNFQHNSCEKHWKCSFTNYITRALNRHFDDAMLQKNLILVQRCATMHHIHPHEACVSVNSFI